ncbi:MAG: HDOD domain-containing protein [Phycisphaeraceae bacterium]|nr:HDOD domain-containing protein [Phycisphaeraceae bacterium]
MENKITILFVDDEQNILQGLRRLLRGLRDTWNMHFVSSAKEALNLLHDNRFDVIVSDMRMPEIDGAELLAQVKQLYPHMVRIVLSGYSDQTMSLRAAESAHRYLSKPCDAGDLRQTVLKILAVQQSLHSQELAHLVTQIDSLPSQPTMYQELSAVLQRESSSVQIISHCIKKDPALTAKILQLVNSSFFGLRQEVINVSDAVKLLGHVLIRSIALSTNLFREFENQHPGLINLYDHSYQVANVARHIAMKQKLSREMTDAAFTAGLLHDTGKMILSSRLPEVYTDVLKEVHETGQPSWEIEKTKLGFNHADIGGYLLKLWGLPDHIVSTVLFHQEPAKSHETQFTLLAAVHAANHIVNKMNHPAKPNRLDHEYLQQLGITDTIRQWETSSIESHAAEGVKL